jgi:hypothetical protein
MLGKSKDVMHYPERDVCMERRSDVVERKRHCGFWSFCFVFIPTKFLPINQRFTSSLLVWLCPSLLMQELLWLSVTDNPGFNSPQYDEQQPQKLCWQVISIMAELYAIHKFTYLENKSSLHL